MVATKTYGSIAQVKGSHLVIESLGDELVAFDRRTNKAHLLDARATAIYRAAENGCSIDDVFELVDGGTLEEKGAAAQLGIMSLESAGLLVSHQETMHRRSLLKRLASAAALPMVISLSAPTPAAATSNIPDGVMCGLTGACVTTDTCLSVGRTCTDANASNNCFCCVNGAGMVAARMDGFSCDMGNGDCCSGNCVDQGATPCTNGPDSMTNPKMCCVGN